MTHVVPGRFTAKTEEPFVVLLIGMRVNRPLAIRNWHLTASAIMPMLREVYMHMEKVFIGEEFTIYVWGPVV